MSLDRFRAGCMLACLAVGQAAAQTRVDLRTQTKSVDFSTATSTKPSQTGAVLPASCGVGQTFLNTSAQPGQNLYICTSANTWSVQGANGLPNYALGFSGQTTVTVPGSMHQLGTAKLFVEVYNNQVPAQLVEPGDVQINPVTYDVMVTFATPQSGTVVISAAGGGGGSGAVGSVFGRVGAVTAQAGDYSFGQIAGSVAGGQLPPAGGDLAGTLSSATVAALRGRPISSAVPSGGQALIWDANGGQWSPQTIAGGNAAGMAGQLGDFLVTRTSAVTLVIGANCSPSTPCNARLGGSVYSVAQSATVTLTSGAGAAYIYLNSAGSLTVGHNLTLSCSAGCTALSGVTAFPVNSIPLFSWTATNNTWDSSGADWRAFLSAKTITAGSGIITVETGSQTLVAVDSAIVPAYFSGSATLAFPAISAGACASEMTFPVTGAAAGDPVAAGWPSSLPAGFLGMMRVSAANTVAVRLCNFSGVGGTPPSATFRATIVKSF